MPLLEVQAISAAYGRREVLHDLSFALEPGSFTAVLGANGAGKTTLLRAICNQVTVRGRIALDGQALAQRSTADIARLGVSHVPEGRGTVGDLTVEENFTLAAACRLPRAQRREAVAHAYSYFPRLQERRKQLAGTLSGGEQQMLSLSRALLGKPRLVLLDEPSLGLAPKTTEELFAALHAIHAAEGMTFLLVEQNAALALRVARDALLLSEGRLLQAGPSATLRDHPQLREAYLGALP